ncbi:MAG: hypothetical protein ACREVX_04235 [Clostridium sp.]
MSEYKSDNHTLKVILSVGIPIIILLLFIVTITTLKILRSNLILLQ